MGKNPFQMGLPHFFSSTLRTLAPALFHGWRKSA
jgi:hypothetical protein